jgi:hypothetical protein
MLPAECDLSGDPEDVVNRLYGVFSESFLESRILHEGRAVEFDRRVINENKVEFFWHLTHYPYTRNKGRGNGAMLDHDRAQRLSWLRIIIENPNSDGLKKFDFIEPVRGGNKGGLRRYVWYESGKYCTVLQPLLKGNRLYAYQLITAFPVDFYGKAAELQRKFENRVK